MSIDTNTTPEQWTADWLATVADGTNTMSQRKLTSIKKHGGGLEVVSKVARAKGVHLVLLTDDKGTELVAASIHPFKVVC